MRNPKVAGRYAKSLLELGIERNELDRLREDFHLIRKVLQENRELRLFLNSPVVNPDKKTKILLQVFEGHLGEIAKSFITILIRKGREVLLLEIVENFEGQYLSFKGISTAMLTTAVPAEENTIQMVVGLAEKISGKNIQLEQKVDPDMIGGFLLRVGDYQLDATVSGKLRAIRKNFEMNHYVAEI